MGARGRVAAAIMVFVLCGCVGEPQKRADSKVKVPLDLSGEDHYRMAVVAYKKVVELQRKREEAKTLPERRRIEGLLDFQWETYRKHLEKAEAALGNDLRVKMLRGAYWFLKGENEKALAVYEGVIAADDGVATAHYMRARCLLRLGRLREAKAACEKALERAPEYRPAAMLLVEIERRIAASHP